MPENAVTAEKQEKRRFYNTGDAKNFTKAKYFETVLAILEDAEVDNDDFDLAIAATRYELEGIALRASAPKAPSNALESDYAKALRKAFSPLLTKTPQTADQLLEAAAKKGILSPKGKPFASQWVHRVLGAEDKVEKVKIIVTKTDNKGLKGEKEAVAYKLV